MCRVVVGVVSVVGLAAGCDGVLHLDDIHPMAPGDAQGPPVPAECTPAAMFGSNAVQYRLFGSLNASALSVSLDETLFVVEDVHVLYRRDADGNRDEPIAPPQTGDELAEPTLDPEANVLYARDITSGDRILGYARASDVFQPAPTLALPTGKRAGNQTLDLGGFRRMIVEYDPGNGMFEFQEYTGSPSQGWSLNGPTYTAGDVTTNASATIQDPALGADGLNMTFVANGDVYYTHRSKVTDRFGQGTLLRTGSYSTPTMLGSCRQLYVVDKTNEVAYRYSIL